MPSQYLTVAELLNAPLGLSLKTVPATGATGPAGVTGAQSYEELTNIIQRASALADVYCQQVLAATTDSEEKWTDGGLAGVDGNGYLWVHTDAWPVLSVLSFQYAFPTTGGGVPPGPWTSVATSDLILFRSRIVYPANFTRRGVPPLRVQYIYLNGWPNTALTGAAAQGATSLPLADTTGMVAGQRLTIYDQGNTEQVTVASTWTPATGAASLALAGPTAFAHTPVFRPATPPQQPYDVAVSALPADVKEAVLLICKELIETRGANALVMSRSGGVAAATAGPQQNPEKVPMEAQYVLDHYRALL